MAPTKLVALGSCCEITYDIERYGLRDESSVFEWYASNSFKDIIKIMNMIATGVEVPFAVRPEFGPDIFLADTDIHTLHYTLETLPSIFKRRATRFIDFVKSDLPLLFIRHDRQGISLEDLEEFKRIIESINPKCNYHLLCSVEPNLYLPISSPRVFYRSKPHGSWLSLIYEAAPGDMPENTDGKADDKD
jgi:hypothetical protein